MHLRIGFKAVTLGSEQSFRTSTTLLINQATAGNKQYRRRNQIRKKGTALLLIEPRSHKHINLRGNNRKGKEDRPEKCQFELSKEVLLRSCENQLQPLLIPCCCFIGIKEDIEDAFSEIKQTPNITTIAATDQINRVRSSIKWSISGA